MMSTKFILLVLLILLSTMFVENDAYLCCGYGYGWGNGWSYGGWGYGLGYGLGGWGWYGKK
ncbi:unnamed protein product [Cylicocyclus nassatus]|uniref:Uncharacterized protein n=1 Tax=Cylicocyclus nassatus TaxID=53992 RepID=A0AA36DLP7_CYLNA|nr:unnamed protein product [Cylicocyclus nassatus]